MVSILVEWDNEMLNRIVEDFERLVEEDYRRDFVEFVEAMVLDEQGVSNKINQRTLT